MTTLARQVSGAHAGESSAGRAAIRAIGVPLDGSEFSRAALAPATALAARLDAELVLIRAAVPAPISGLEGGLAERLGETDALQSLREIAARVRAQSLRARELALAALAGASPAQAILNAIDESGAGLIVMATHGRTGLQRAVLGSVAGAVVAGAHVPLLLVRPYFGSRAGDGAASWVGWESATLEAIRRGATAEPLRLMCALDGTTEAEAALVPAAELARALGASISLVRITLGGVAHSGARPSSMSAIDEAAAYLQRAAGQLHAAGVDPRSVRVAVRVGRLPDALLDQAARERASILVLATHARSGLTRLLHGSVAADVVTAANLPVLLVRKQEAPGRAWQSLVGYGAEGQAAGQLAKAS